mmetsp:Transcript_94232/g.266104  ORF Transcript_94232/g.266104 Transcript_94232/m.266104 type:complete len:207 (-) Transcript_94232:369-989(-)
MDYVRHVLVDRKPEVLILLAVGPPVLSQKIREIGLELDATNRGKKLRLALLLPRQPVLQALKARESTTLGDVEGLQRLRVFLWIASWQPIHVCVARDGQLCGFVVCLEGFHLCQFTHSRIIAVQNLRHRRQSGQHLCNWSMCRRLLTSFGNRFHFAPKLLNDANMVRAVASHFLDVAIDGDQFVGVLQAGILTALQFVFLRLDFSI